MSKDVKRGNLVLSRKPGQSVSVQCGCGCASEVMVAGIGPGKVSLAFRAGPETRILREELVAKKAS